MPRQQFKTRYTSNNHDGIDDLRQQLDEHTSELRADISLLEEHLGNTDQFTDELEQKQLLIVDRLECLEAKPQPQLPAPIPVLRQLPAPEQEPVPRLRKLLNITVLYVIGTVDTPFFGAAAFSALVALLQVSTFYTFAASILFITAMLVGYKKLTSVPF